MMKATRTPAQMHMSIKEWVWGMEEDAPKGEVRKDNAVNHAGLSKGTLILSILVEGRRSAQKARKAMSFLETPLVVHPLLGLGVLIREAIEVPNILP